MERLKGFAGKRPLLFALFVLVSWFLVSGVFTILGSLLSGIIFSDPLPQSIGMIGGTLYVLLLCWRFGWLEAAGIAELGSRQTWLITIAVMVYLILALWLAFFGDISLDIGLLRASGDVIPVIGRQIIVGIAEELLFRGIILYTLVRVWGRTYRGLVGAVIVSSLFFGIPHYLQLFAGKDAGLGLMAVLESFVSGLWWALLVLIFGTLWPAVLFHTGSNTAVILKTLTIPGIVLSINGYALAILVQLPLVILGLWWLRKMAPRPVIPEAP